MIKIEENDNIDILKLSCPGKEANSNKESINTVPTSSANYFHDLQANFFAD